MGERRTLHLQAPAKLNLALRILGARPDGYHLLESLFVPVDLADEIELTVESDVALGGVRLELLGAADRDALPLRGVPADARNLAVRAAERFVAAAGIRADVAIRLTKRVPAAAGLGGGSSDAGAVLRGLAALHPAALDATALAELALDLGADVPFFLAPEPALVEGIGEVLTQQSGLPALPVLLANPGESVDTAQVYAAWDALSGALTPVEPGSTMRALSDLRALAEGVRPGDREGRLDGLEGEDVSIWAACLRALVVNDLEPAATRLCPPVGRIRARIEESGALATGMSGSGATVFGIFASERAAREAAERLASTIDAAAPGAPGEGRQRTWIHVGRTSGSVSDPEGVRARTTPGATRTARRTRENGASTS
jgi:4-diphosphocytidyl-2-C-methyl-D-erythritol kinase